MADSGSSENGHQPTQTEAEEANISQELPFLVTNWLANYRSPSGDAGCEAEKRIRDAAAELASAFASAGAFGTRTTVTLSPRESSVLRSSQRGGSLRNLSFADVQRQWNTTCPPSQLESIVQASADSLRTMEGVTRATRNPNVSLLARENMLESIKRPTSGRTLQDAVEVDAAVEAKGKQKNVPSATSSLHAPIVLTLRSRDIKRSSGFNVAQERTVGMESRSRDAALNASNIMKRMLDLRESCRVQDAHLKQLSRSLEFQNSSKKALVERRSQLLMDPNMDANTQTNAMHILQDEEQNCIRVIAQLERQRQTSEHKIFADRQELDRVKIAVKESCKTFNAVSQQFHDPLFSENGVTKPGLSFRRSELTRLGYHPSLQKLGITPSCRVSYTKRSILRHRLSHAATINTHLAYPVYCLRFDKTGRYFLTGADDYLVKLFCLGSDTAVATARHGAKPVLDVTSYVRGAVHVCTLRGHAGVINDIDVSSDNSLLATASEDGDVRVWGLKDGSPVAILRGHGGGANMVSWSILTPFNLVTTAADGLARTWDIRAACLKRYGAFVGGHPEYQSPNLSASSAAESSTLDTLPVPPVQPPQNESAPQQPSVPLPAIPLGPENLAVPPAPEDEHEPGSFVANDNLDEGVKLLSKLQHGATSVERSTGIGTRGRRAAVKVICVARCPFGGHFATGSDDGICRLWRDEDNSAVEAIDRLHEKSRSGTCTQAANMRNGKPLLSLKGHFSAITDLQYSHAGDRIITASQRDGVVRIWSWASDPSQIKETHNGHSENRDSSTSHILLKLSNPAKVAKAATQTGRRRPASASANVSCDVAQWIQDDSFVVTSQCELLKQSGTDIVPESQYIFLWDSRTGDCLMGIAGAHTMQCAVAIPHPTESSILCTAGADGFVKMWDLEAGQCFFSHKNMLDFGPVDPNDKGKISGYLDGAFFPSGCGVVLTDDSGRVSVFDCNLAHRFRSKESPGWSREQYFANDYYELLYDENGYCIERGSEKPPHLAPRSVRCTHSGVPWSSSVTETFRGLVGPFPDAVSESRRKRGAVRFKGSTMRVRSYVLRPSRVCEYSPRGTTLIGDKPLLESSAAVNQSPSTPQAATGSRSAPRSANRLSSNWRWGDAFAELRDDGPGGDDQESDDEEFELVERHVSADNVRLSDSEESDLEAEEFVSEETPTRQSRRVNVDTEEFDDEDEMEYGSNNNVVSGRYVADYDRHYWNFGNSRGHLLNKNWVLRTESASSYNGRKRYVPQVGDTVVYIPRAHYEFLEEFPQGSAPWVEWPEEAVWPLARCKIRNLRYRLPFHRSFVPGNKMRGIVVILTLEVTGIPQLEAEREVSWPSPNFVEPTGSHRFEMSVFETNTVDFIVPYGLYCARLADLEKALVGSNSPSVEAFYSVESGEADSEYIPYPGVIDNIVASDDVGNSHLSGSGYRSVSVSWGSSSEGDDDRVSPWEVRTAVEDPVIPERPCLTEEEKNAVRDALTHVKTLDGISEVFAEPVDQNRYYDYAARIEVPMDLSFVATRLDSDFYASRHSVVRDVRLIQENAAKYNGSEDELAHLAQQLVEAFQQRILSVQEIKEWSDLEDEMLARAPPRAQENSQPPAEENITAPIRRSGRTRRLTTRDMPNESQPSGLVRRSRRRRVTRRRTFDSGLEADNNVRGQPLAALNTRGRASHRRGNASEAQSMRTTRGRAQRVQQEQQAPLVRQDGSLGVRLRQRQDRPNEFGERRSQRHRGAVMSSYVDEASDVDMEESINVPNHEENAGQGPGDSDAVEDSNDVEEEVQVATRTRRGHRSSSVMADSSESEEEARPSRTRAARRRSQTGTASESDEEVMPTRSRARTRMSDIADSSESEGEQRPARGRARSRRSSVRDDQSSEGEVGRTVSRRNRRAASDEWEVDNEDEEEEAEFDEEEEEESDGAGPSSDESTGKASRKGRRNAAARAHSPTRSARSRRGAQPSYADAERSDVDEDEESDAKPRARPKRKGDSSHRGSGRAKKTKTDNGNGGIESQSKPWPEIDVKNITTVARAVLSSIREIDRDGFFALPVVEAAPEVAASYMELIDQPMDLRTIEEDRLPTYRSIRDLQQDLLLIIENCFTFNGRENEYSLIATVILESLDDIFRRVCSEENMTIPRRW